MTYSLKMLNELETVVAAEKKDLAKLKTEHGSIEQTRTMLFESIFEQALANITAAKKQLEIISRELY